MAATRRKSTIGARKKSSVKSAVRKLAVSKKPRIRSKIVRKSSKAPLLTGVSVSGIQQKDLDAAVARVKVMTKKERIQSLIDSGILTSSGKLANAYKS